MADNILFDFDNESDAKRSLKKVSQIMLRAGQPVVSSSYDLKPKRTAGVGYRQAMLTLASGQTVTLMVKLTGDVFRVLLNGNVLPIHQQDATKALAEIAAAAKANQAKFQKQLARKAVEIPKGIKSAAPKIEHAQAERIEQLAKQIEEATTRRDELKAELGEQALDSVQGTAEEEEEDEDREPFEDDVTEPLFDSADEPEGEPVKVTGTLFDEA
ncbi:MULTISPECIES: hypothetical protein [Pseudomonas]|uniref:Defence against restriction A N-terminal domain-containing protein n=1 Tax=Pseudomonas lutea TaxID=243924 RepID=A0A9X8MH09_9PSED|nr:MULTISPECIES: hypothetical protein [Pseudomonas]SER35696.1 hypothetical protein SAMN05216409_11821 [Pseudomonas lutea]